MDQTNAMAAICLDGGMRAWMQSQCTMLDSPVIDGTRSTISRSWSMFLPLKAENHAGRTIFLLFVSVHVGKAKDDPAQATSSKNV